MATSKLHPESLKEVNSLKITGELKEFVKDLEKDIETEKSDRVNLEEAVNRLTKLRYGVRKRKTRPWVGASNIVIPQIDTDIAKMKPSYVNLAFGVSPIATFEPYGGEDVEAARLKEELFDWRMRTKVKFFKPYNYGIDMVLGPPGQTVFRVIWKFASRKYVEMLDIEDLPEEVIEVIFDPRVTDEMLAKIIIEELRIDEEYDENIDEVDKAVKKFREGKTKLELNLLETKDDRPDVTAVHPYYDLVVPLDTKELQDARFIDYKFWISKNDLKIGIEDGKYDKYSDHDIESWKSKKVGAKQGQMDSDELILMHETCCWYDIDKDGIEEKCIVTWPDADSSSVLRFIENPYDHGLWPFVQVKRELTEEGFYASRGLASLEEDFQVAISTAINQAIDNGTLTNMPERVARKGLISNPRNRRFIPGEFTEVNGDVNQYQTRQGNNASQPGLFQQAQYLKSWVDNRLGQVTSGLGSGTDLPGTGERGKKTAKEVEAITALQGQTESLDLQVFQQQMADVYYQIDTLYDQFGPEEETILVTGQPPRSVSRSEIQGKFDIVPNGRLDNSNPRMRLQKSMFAYQIGFQNPLVKQDELLRMVFKDLDSRIADNLLYSEEEQAQIQQQQQQLEAQLEAEELQKTVGMRKLSDDLDIRKEALLVPLQGKKFAPN